MEKIFFEGFLLQASLILALGAQNIFILESGLKRQHHLLASFICFVCDLSLILLGVAGATTLFTHLPFAKILVGLVGVFFLFTYGLNKFLSKDYSIVTGNDLVGPSLKRCALLAVTFSVLNPHAYLDAFVLIGGMSSKYDLLHERLAFGFGAAIYSGVWFVVLSSFASVLKPFLQDARRMRVLMSSAGAFLIFLSLKLGSDVYGWIIAETKMASVDFSPVVHPVSWSYFTSILY